MYDTKGSGAFKEGGESETKYSGNASDGKMEAIDSAGVKDGLSMSETMDVKDAESVTHGQRPIARKESAGDGYIIGIC